MISRFARRQRLQDLLDLVLQIQVDHRLDRRLHLPSSMKSPRCDLPPRRPAVERDRVPARSSAPSAPSTPGCPSAWRSPRWSARGPSSCTSARDVRELAHRLDHVHRDADRAGLVGDRAGDRLADPPRGVRGELVAAAVLVLVDRPHQAGVAFLDEVQELRPRLRYFLAIETTSRRLASTSSFFACSACTSPR